MRDEAGEVVGAPNKNSHTKEPGFQTEGCGELLSELKDCEVCGSF